MSIKNKLQNTVVKAASKVLVHYYDPIYKDLGEDMSVALEVARNVVPAGIITHEGRQSMSYYIGYYQAKFSTLFNNMGRDEVYDLLWDINMMLYYAEMWQKSHLNPEQEQFAADALRDHADMVFKRANRMPRTH